MPVQCWFGTLSGAVSQITLDCRCLHIFLNSWHAGAILEEVKESGKCVKTYTNTQQHLNQVRPHPPAK